MFGIGYGELVVIGIVALLLYGQRLPEVARTWGNTYRDLRRSLNDMKSSISIDTSPPTPRISQVEEYDDRENESAPKFIPPPPGRVNSGRVDLNA